MKIFLAVVVTLSLVACKDKGGTGKAAGGKVASCNMPSMGQCREYNEDNLAMGSDLVASVCSKEIVKDSSFTMTACPTADLVSSCAEQTHKDYYYKTSTELDKVEKRCATANPPGSFEKK